MAWMMLWAFNLSIVQVEFSSEELCEAARVELVEAHAVSEERIACVRVGWQ